MGSCGDIAPRPADNADGLMFSTSRQNASEVSAPRLWAGSTASDWQAATLASGQSVGGLLRAHGLPANRSTLAAVAQANGITDFRRIPAGATLWLPRAETLAAPGWSQARGAISADAFAVVDADVHRVVGGPRPASAEPASRAAASAPASSGPAVRSAATTTAPAARPTPAPATTRARLVPGSPAAQRMNQLATELARQLHGPKNRDEIIRLTTALMQSSSWTNADARAAYARAAGTPNDPWKIIRDIRSARGLTATGNGFSHRDALRVSEYVYSDESTPFDGDVSPAMRAVFAGIGWRDRGMFRLDAAVGTSAPQLEDALWSIVNTIGVAKADAIIWTRAGSPGGLTANLKSEDGPVDGSLVAPPAGTHPLRDFIDREYGNVGSRLLTFGAPFDRERMRAIIRQPRGTDRASFDIGLQAYEAEGEDFLKLFVGRTVEQVRRISASYQATYNASLESRAQRVLNTAQLSRFGTLLQGTKSSPEVAERYVAETLPVTPREAQAELLKLSPNRFIKRTGFNADSPSVLALRIMTSNDPAEIAGSLRRTDGSPWSDVELAVMNQIAAEYAGTNASAKPSAFYTHVAKVTGNGSPSAVAVARVGSQPLDASLYDQDGRLSPAAQLYYALYTRDDEEVANILASSTVVDLSTIERSYPAVARALTARGVPPPGNATTAKAAIQAVMRGEPRRQALAFMTGIDVTSLASAGSSGAAIAAAVTRDLNSRCAWLLRQFDHEREPLRERLMQFEVTLAEVLTNVQERRQREGHAVELTEDEQRALGNAVGALVRQQTVFAGEREDIARTIQDTTILVATVVASTTLTVGSAGFGAPAGLALLNTARNIGTVAAVGAGAGLVTAPLMGGDNPYVTSAARGAAWGGFTGLGASLGWMQSALAKVIPGEGIIAVTARNMAIMGTTSAGLGGARHIGTAGQYDTPEEARAAALKDIRNGALMGSGFALTMGFAAALNAWGNGADDVLGLGASRAAGASQGAAPVAAGQQVTFSQVSSRIQNEANVLATRALPGGDATQIYARLGRLGEMDAMVLSMRQAGAPEALLSQTTARIAASRTALDTALSIRVRDMFLAAGTQATTAETVQGLNQVRQSLVNAGFATTAPKTMSELNAVAQRLGV